VVFTRIIYLDQDFAKSIEATKARLAPLRVNKDGRIMEWQEDFEEAEVGHRHTSHLWAIHPGTEISSKTPELLKGVRLSLDRRGPSVHGLHRAIVAEQTLRAARHGRGIRTQPESHTICVPQCGKRRKAI
jgi:hypothetical protein